MRTLAFICSVVLATGPAGCKSEPDGPVRPASAEDDRPPPPDLRVSAERTDLVFSYATSDGFATATRISDVPDDARREVIVTDLSLSPEARQADRYVYLADLRRARDDGSYPVALVRRYGLEKTLAATGASAAPAAVSREVIVYTTAWCGVCKKAKRLLGQLGVRYVETDIEGSKKAAEELAAKSAAAGLRTGGVPVIDVAGTLLQGLDERTLRQTLTDKGLL
jgi:mycoredoxin